jgi:uncharacterized protein (DUF433 family)
MQAAAPASPSDVSAAHSGCIGMKTKVHGHRRRVELGRHIVADSKICGGQPTFKGARITVWIVLEQLDRGMSWDEILREWPGRFPKAAISEAIAISDLVVKHEPFKGFNVGVLDENLPDGQPQLLRKAYGLVT